MTPLTVSEAIADERRGPTSAACSACPAARSSISWTLSAGVESTLFRHELDAGIAAGIYEKRKETAGVVLTTLGPGASSPLLPVASSLLGTSARTASRRSSDHGASPPAGRRVSMTLRAISERGEAMIEMTPVAAEKLRELRGTDPSRAFLRMYVAGKSCCSTQFGLAFDASPDEKDTVSDVAGIPLAVDPLSQPYADGAIIDFVDGPDGTGFLVKNPTLGGGCSCAGGRD